MTEQLHSNPTKFARLYDQFRALPEAERNALVESKSGELGVICDMWIECCNTVDPKPYDPCDAGYIFIGLRDLHQLHYMLVVNDIDLLRFWAMALLAACEIMHSVDFEGDYDFGVFCYEHLGTAEGELVHQIYYRCVQHSELVADVVRAYAVSKGWPLKGK